MSDAATRHLPVARSRRLDRDPARATGLTMSSVFPGADRERMGEGRAPLPEGISMFSQVERVVAEEYAPTHGLGV
jgi:hypothetical protein